MISSILKKCNILSFIGITFSCIGICFCYSNMINYAIIMMIFAGICDAFDGPIARKINKGNNPYGIQLDSLSDIICSGVLPINICLAIGYNSWMNIIIYIIFIMCGIIRLAYYNVNSSNKDYFEGVPITFSTMLIPLVYLLLRNEVIFMITLSTLSIFFVSGIKIKKPSLKLRIILSIIGLIFISYIIIV